MSNGFFRRRRQLRGFTVSGVRRRKRRSYRCDRHLQHHRKLKVGSVLRQLQQPYIGLQDRRWQLRGRCHGVACSEIAFVPWFGAFLASVRGRRFAFLDRPNGRLRRGSSGFAGAAQTILNLSRSDFGTQVACVNSKQAAYSAAIASLSAAYNACVSAAQASLSACGSAAEFTYNSCVEACPTGGG